MVNGTTTPITLTVGEPNEVDLSSALGVYVTLEQGNVEITLTGDSVQAAGNTVVFNLTQAQSLNFSDSAPIEVQVNWTYYDEGGNVQRAATKTKKITVTKQLLKQVIS